MKNALVGIAGLFAAIALIALSPYPGWETVIAIGVFASFAGVIALPSRRK